jgi:hypothetical protein
MAPSRSDPHECFVALAIVRRRAGARSKQSCAAGHTDARYWATAAARCRIRPLLLRSAAGPHGRFLKTLPRASEQAARDLRAPLLLRLAEQHFGPLVVGVSPRRATRPLVLVRRSSFGCLDRALSGVCVAGEHQSEVSLLQGERSSMAPPVRDLVDATPHDLVLFATVPSDDRRVRVRGGVEALL